MNFSNLDFYHRMLSIASYSLLPTISILTSFSAPLNPGETVLVCGARQWSM